MPHAAVCIRVSWHANDVQLRPDDQLLPLQVVSGTHLDINLTFQPPASCFTQSESGKTLVKASLTDSWIARKLLPQPLDPLNPANPRVGLVFKSWRADGQGAAVLSFDWSNYELAVDFDAPFPDAYNPHPEDTPERRRIGGKLMNYTPGWLQGCLEALCFCTTMAYPARAPLLKQEQLHEYASRVDKPVCAHNTALYSLPTDCFVVLLQVHHCLCVCWSMAASWRSSPALVKHSPLASIVDTHPSAPAQLVAVTAKPTTSNRRHPQQKLQLPARMKQASRCLLQMRLWW